MDEQRLRLLRLRQAQTKAQGPQAQPTGADAMRAQGLSSPDPAFANQQAEAMMRPPMEKASDAYGQFSQGAFEGLTGLMGAPSDIASLLLSKTTGKDVDLPLGGEDIASAMKPNAEPIEPRTELERRVRTAGEYIGPGMAVGGLGGLRGLGAAAVADTGAGLAAGEVREQGGGPVAEVAAALAAGGLPLAAGNAVSKAGQTRRAIDAVPGIAERQAQATALYDAGEKTGKTASRAYTDKLSETITGIAKKEGLISPTGRLSTAYPKVSDALAMVKDYAGQKMTPEQMREVRSILSGAAQSADGKEARIGTMMLKQFDEFVAPLVPEFKEADKLWAMSKRGEEVKEAVDIAKTRRTGLENSLSNEFQGLQRKEIRGDLTYPKELVEAVERAANGGPTRAAARGVGKLAPTGVVSLGTGTGIPAILGAMLAGPAGAVIGGGAAGTTGIMGKLLATRLAKGDAKAALATALNGAPLEQAQTPEAIKAAIAALLASTGLQGPQ
jgi:hypothetical protein